MKSAFRSSSFGDRQLIASEKWRQRSHSQHWEIILTEQSLSHGTLMISKRFLFARVTLGKQRRLVQLESTTLPDSCPCTDFLLLVVKKPLARNSGNFAIFLPAYKLMLVSISHRSKLSQEEKRSSLYSRTEEIIDSCLDIDFLGHLMK